LHVIVVHLFVVPFLPFGISAPSLLVCYFGAATLCDSLYFWSILIGS
jgi:hypothetical protein